MTIAELLLPEVDQELAITRRVLERVPDDKLAWKPHDKSWTMAHLASHVVTLLRWSEVTMNQTEFDMAIVPPDQMNQTASSRAQLLEWFDTHVIALRKALDRSDADYAVSWSLKYGDQLFFTLPRYACIRSYVLNHHVHHRAQLSVYLRLTGVSVPAMYGPSADEQQ